MIKEILQDREKRYNRILGLIEEYRLPVLCGKLNYPGENKNTPESDRAFSILMEVVLPVFSEYARFTTLNCGADGKSILMAVEGDLRRLKKLCTDIEDGHKIGRIFDLDVYGLDGAPLDRKSLGLSPRGCIACEEDARICIKTGKHSLSEVLRIINSLINSFNRKEYERIN